MSDPQKTNHSTRVPDWLPTRSTAEKITAHGLCVLVCGALFTGALLLTLRSVEVLIGKPGDAALLEDVVFGTGIVGFVTVAVLSVLIARLSLKQVLYGALEIWRSFAGSSLRHGSVAIGVAGDAFRSWVREEPFPLESFSEKDIAEELIPYSPFACSTSVDAVRGYVAREVAVLRKRRIALTWETLVNFLDPRNLEVVLSELKEDSSLRRTTEAYLGELRGPGFGDVPVLLGQLRGHLDPHSSSQPLTF